MWHWRSVCCNLWHSNDSYLHEYAIIWVSSRSKTINLWCNSVWHRDRFAWHRIITLLNESKLCIPKYFCGCTHFFEFGQNQRWLSDTHIYLWKKKKKKTLTINFSVVSKCQLESYFENNTKLAPVRANEFGSCLFCLEKFLNKQFWRWKYTNRIRW